MSEKKRILELQDKYNALHDELRFARRRAMKMIMEVLNTAPEWQGHMPVVEFPGNICLESPVGICVFDREENVTHPLCGYCGLPHYR
jgi:hypothetical protein